MSTLLLAVFLLASAAPARLAQDRPKNPREGDPVAIRTGTALFQARCASCHGIDARGVVGPDLTTLWASGATDERLFRTVRRGIPGTDMPSSTGTDTEIWAVLAYLRSLAKTVADEDQHGNAENGERLFWASCGGCHRVNGRGGHLGPDLSRIGSSRSRATLVREIRDASASIAAGYRPVTVVLGNGERIRGAKKSEDAFSILIMDVHERLQGYLKADVKEVVNEGRSLMPDFGVERLNDGDLDDLLRFLGNLRGSEVDRR
jgi:putative heme-binding domain-containing protein